MAHRSGILKRCGAILFPGPYQFDSEPPEGTLRSSVVHSPGRASSNPLAWLASIAPAAAARKLLLVPAARSCTELKLPLSTTV